MDPAYEYKCAIFCTQVLFPVSKKGWTTLPKMKETNKYIKSTGCLDLLDYFYTFCRLTDVASGNLFDLICQWEAHHKTPEYCRIYFIDFCTKVFSHLLCFCSWKITFSSDLTATFIFFLPNPQYEQILIKKYWFCSISTGQAVYSLTFPFSHFISCFPALGQIRSQSRLQLHKKIEMILR